jgi:hypothetical protein
MAAKLTHHGGQIIYVIYIYIYIFYGVTYVYRIYFILFFPSKFDMKTHHSLN